MTGSMKSPHCTQRRDRKFRWPLSSRRSMHCSVTMRPPHREHLVALASCFQPVGFSCFRSFSGTPAVMAIDGLLRSWCQLLSCDPEIVITCVSSIPLSTFEDRINRSRSLSHLRRDVNVGEKRGCRSAAVGSGLMRGWYDEEAAPKYRRMPNDRRD